jgi:hypothetical protein
LFPCRDQCAVKGGESSSSIIFAEFTSEKEKSDIGDENNRLVTYTTEVVLRDSSERGSSAEHQENGLPDLSIRSLVKQQLPLRHNSDLEEDLTSTEESSEENLNLGQTEVEHFQRACPVMFTHSNCMKGGNYMVFPSTADFPLCALALVPGRGCPSCHLASVFALSYLFWKAH